MKKIKSLFERNYDGDGLVRNEVVAGSEWVINGEGVPTRKFDGTCCKVESGILYKRYDAKKLRTPPDGFIPAQDYDPITDHMPGWVAVSESEPSDKWHVKAFLEMPGLPDGTYELCGEKIQKNPERVIGYVLIPHGKEILDGCPRDYDGIKAYLVDKDIEGVVWHRDNGDMVKIKKTDFGLKR